MKKFSEWLIIKENINEVEKSDIYNQELPETLKPLFKSVSRMNRQSDRNTLFYLLPKYDQYDINLDAHGLAKANLGFQFQSLINMLKTNTVPLHTAPLTTKVAGIGAGLGASHAYRDGSFIVVAEYGKTLKKDGIKYVIVDGRFADVEPIDGKTGTQILQQELGQGGKYEFIDGGENNNQLDSFFARFTKLKTNTIKPEKSTTPKTLEKPTPLNSPPKEIFSVF